MAALDYGRLRRQLDRGRLLVIAHSENILNQAITTFGYALRGRSIRGEVGRGFEADHFDVVIVDEFHHAAAPSYERLLGHLASIELESDDGPVLEVLSLPVDLLSPRTAA